MSRLAANSVIAVALILPSLIWAAQEEAQRRDPLRPPGDVVVDTGPAFNADAWRLMSTLVADGRRVASGDASGAVRLWDYATATCTCSARRGMASWMP